MTIKPVSWTEPAELARVIDDEIGSMWGGKESDDQIALCLHSEASAEIERLKSERDASFAMSRCECGTDEACANMASYRAEIARLTEENKRLREALQLVRLSGGWLRLSEETKTIIIDRLDVERPS